MLHEAIERRNPYDLILLDSLMPDMDGYELLCVLKSDSLFDQLRVIIMHPSNTRWNWMADVKVSGCLTKPIIHSELLDTLLKIHLGPAFQECAPKKVAEVWSEVNVHANILLAEDNLINQRLAIRILEKMGHTVTLAENGLQAVAAAKKQHFDLILMDVQMPEMGGFEATAVIREYEKQINVHTPIIAMTAHALYGYYEKCLEADMDDYVSKPINIKVLKEKIQHFIHKNGE